MADFGTIGTAQFARAGKAAEAMSQAGVDAYKKKADAQVRPERIELGQLGELHAERKRAVIKLPEDSLT